MKRWFLALALVTSLPATPALADAPAASTIAAHGRIVPTLRDGQLIGFKVYAIKPNGRFAAAGLENGDLMTAIDGQSVTTDAGTRAFADNVIDGKADCTLTVTRRGQTVTLTSHRT